MPGRSSYSVKVSYPRLSRTQVVEHLQQKLDELTAALPLERVVLFGSYARGNYTVGSDIDLLVVCKEETLQDPYKLVRRIVALRGLEVHVYTSQDYEALRPTLDRMTSDAIVIFPSSARRT